MNKRCKKQGINKHNAIIVEQQVTKYTYLCHASMISDCSAIDLSWAFDSNAAPLCIEIQSAGMSLVIEPPDPISSLDLSILKTQKLIVT